MSSKKEEVKPYCFVTIKLARPKETGYDWHNQETLYTYDLPRDFVLGGARWAWLIRWRISLLQCKYPKCNVKAYYGFYDKKTGMDMGIGSTYARLVSAKGMITKISNKIEAARGFFVPSLFYTKFEQTEGYCKAYAKLEEYLNKVKELTSTLEEEKKKFESNG